ncbi:uncharacterized protein KY384_004624 [Bacidia gigantensis]|uniref:uncharacterized protein n=1 Tax=Bacidia gigantensis TaxID=2732470 RepID=UPI001D049863|nr:uncharacterized protein KY384_004624 [Bacidia gigantensis]KAG8531266.1 hypothetical protein KY384_004624 [Bacidia gigantensis]
MLFMAVQDYHEARLPSGLQDVYVQYKQDTRAIIAWLVSHGPSRYKASQRLSIKDLRKLADYIRTKAVEMPDVIGFQFRQAIAARSRLSKVFRSGIDQSQRFTRTEDHEFFTNSALVADCVDEDEDDREILPESEDSRQPAEACAESARPVDLNCSPIIAEDHLGVAFEACQLVNELVTLLNKIHSIWDEAARGELSVVAAAVLSSAAYTACGDIENRLALSCQIIDPAELHRICNQANEAFHASMSPDESSLLSNNLTTGLDDCWQNLLKLKYHSLKNGFEQDILTNQGSFSITLANGGTSAAIDCECRKVLLRNIVHCLTDKRQINNVIRLGTPVYAEVGFMLTHTNEQSQSLHGSLGLHMLLESYKTYAFKIAPKPASLCRLQALKFAQAALPSIDAVLDSPTMPCRCHGTLAYHLENVKLDFTYYLKLKQFDLFFQSPWVCGSHIVEMLHILHYYGLRLFAYRRYVGSVIHMYNALRQMTDFEPIEVLEDMSATFSDLFFPGGRPTRRLPTLLGRPAALPFEEISA